MLFKSPLISLLSCGTDVSHWQTEHKWKYVLLELFVLTQIAASDGGVRLEFTQTSHLPGHKECSWTALMATTAWQRARPRSAGGLHIYVTHGNEASLFRIFQWGGLSPLTFDVSMKEKAKTTAPTKRGSPAGDTIVSNSRPLLVL